MELVLHNDNKNSFKYVYAALMKDVNHLPIQAEQCANIAHNNGQCIIKVGELDELLEIKSKLENRKLIITLQ